MATITPCYPSSPPEPVEAVHEWLPCWNICCDHPDANGDTWEDYAMSRDELDELLPVYRNTFGTFTVSLLENDL